MAPPTTTGISCLRACGEPSNIQLFDVSWGGVRAARSFLVCGGVVRAWREAIDYVLESLYGSPKARALRGFCFRGIIVYA
jgi:hypothetical protein